MDIASVVWNAAFPEMVFLTLENDLAGDDQPVVRLVGPVDDVAGNSQGTGEVTAAGRHRADSVSVSVDGSSGTVTNGTLTVLVRCGREVEEPREDQRHHGDRGRSRRPRERTKGKAGGRYEDQVSAAAFRTVTTGEQWEWTFNFREGANSKYNVCVEIADHQRYQPTRATRGRQARVRPQR